MTVIVLKTLGTIVLHGSQEILSLCTLQPIFVIYSVPEVYCDCIIMLINHHLPRLYRDCQQNIFLLLLCCNNFPDRHLVLPPHLRFYRGAQDHCFVCTSVPLSLGVSWSTSVYTKVGTACFDIAGTSGSRDGEAPLSL